MLWHFWKIRRAGGLFLKAVGDDAGEADASTASSQLSARPHLFVREKAAAAVVLAALLYAAIFFNAPLGPHANPGLTPATVKAPWYFVALQELLIHVNPLVVVLILPILPAFFLLFFPLVGENSVKSVKLIRLLFVGLVAGFTILMITGVLFRGPGMHLIWPF
jgi:quinol-cytochrome oxidoreductase complex cytochrome b subunit